MDLLLTLPVLIPRHLSEMSAASWSVGLETCPFILCSLTLVSSSEKGPKTTDDSTFSSFARCRRNGMAGPCGVWAWSWSHEMTLLPPSLILAAFPQLNSDVLDCFSWLAPDQGNGVELG